MLSDASTTIPDKTLRERLQKMDNEMAEKQASRSNDYCTRNHDEEDLHEDAIGINHRSDDDIAGELDGRVEAMEKELEEREAEIWRRRSLARLREM